MNDLDLLADVYQKLVEKKNKLDGLRPLPKSAIEKIKDSLSIEWTYNSNSIEGNTLSLRETQMVIREGFTVKGKSLREHFEAFNHDKAILHLEALVLNQNPLSVSDILSIHERIMRNIDDDFAGRLRNGAVRIQGANFTPPNAAKVVNLLDELLDFVKENKRGFNAIAMATIFHHRFVWIHPFFDGNGRTVRLAMNMLLMRSGYPPAIILRNDRKKYYDALNEANGGNYFKLALLMAQAVERSLNIYLSAGLGGDDDAYRPITELASEPGVPYGDEYLSLLARQGKIEAHKEGRQWFTSRNALKRYFKNRKRIREVNRKG